MNKKTILYIDASAGASGDMLMGALYGLCPGRDDFLAAMNALPLPGLALRPEPREGGVHMAVTLHGHEEDAREHTHTHRTLGSVLEMLRSFPLPAKVREDARAVYTLLADAEAKAHNAPVAEIHFHEVGMDDALAEIAGVSLLVSTLAPDEIVCSPVATGSGTVRCAHGELPVPAPAAAALLEGIPTFPGPGTGELCTPTGAALLKYFATRFEALPAPEAPALGYGSRSFATHRNALGAWLKTEEDDYSGAPIRTC